MFTWETEDSRLFPGLSLLLPRNFWLELQNKVIKELQPFPTPFPSSTRELSRRVCGSSLFSAWGNNGGGEERVTVMTYQALRIDAVISRTEFLSRCCENCHPHFTDEKTEVLTDLGLLRSHKQLVKEPNPSDPVKCS